MRYLFILNIGLLFFTLTSCGILEKCNENIIFKRKFFATIEEVKLFYFNNSNGKEITNDDRKLFATNINKLGILTKLKHSAAMDYRFGYQSEEMLDEDVKRWEEWYEKNKCDYLVW